MVDAAVVAPWLELTECLRRSAALSNANGGSAAATLSNANANAGAVAAAPGSKAKTVASRYLAAASISTAARSSSATSPAPRRPTSTERSRPALLPSAVAADASASIASATTTTRTLAVAFQSPTYCLGTSRERSASLTAVAAITPEKRRSGTAGAAVRSKVSDGAQNTYRCPASAAAAPCGDDGRAVAKSMDHSSPNKKDAAAIFGDARSRAFDRTPRRASVDGANEYLRALSSDTDSVSSGGSHDGGADKPGPGIATGVRPSPTSTMNSSARFSRDTVGTRSDQWRS